MDVLNSLDFAAIALGAFLVGLAKGGLPGLGNITVVLFALALPAKASVGILLPVLLAADIVAVLVYKKHALWPYIVRLMPPMIGGILIGYFVFGSLDNDQVKRIIGGVLLSMTAIHLTRKWLRRNKTEADKLPHHPLFVWSTGIIGGFATMMANAAGPVAALFFIASGLPKYAYIGTSAWFFFLVNIFKIPFMVDLGIIGGASLKLSAQLMIFAVLGAVVAPLIVKHINQKLFEVLIWVFVVIGGLKLIIP